MDTLTISTSLLDREDLDIYSKMCCIVLARLSQEEQQETLSLEELALRMGCTTRLAGKALEQLIDKGLLIETAEAGEPKPQMRRVRRKDQESPAVTFEAFDAPQQTAKQKLESLRAFIREPATDGTLRIILNMAGGDVDRVRKAYQTAAASQFSDTLEALMHALQQGAVPEPAEPKVPPVPAVPAEPAPASEGDVSLEPETRQVLTQINQKRIAELYMKNKRKRHP